MNIVIFSRDRACQLDALLRSLKANFAEYDSAYVSVVWKGSRGFKGAYTKITDKFPEVNMIMEDNFKQQTIGAIDEENDYTMFLVDDILFKQPFSVTDPQFKLLKRGSFLCISLRLDENINHCYATNSAQAVPDVSSTSVWNWTKAEGDWAYPMSLDGNIYRTKLIKKVVRSVEFDHPNNLESELDGYVKHLHPQSSPKRMTCYPNGSRLFNVPANRVQDSVKNRHEDSHSAKDLNGTFYKNDKVIDISKLSEVKNNSCHWPFEFEFVRESDWEC